MSTQTFHRLSVFPFFDIKLLRMLTGLQKQTFPLILGFVFPNSCLDEAFQFI